MTLIIILLLQYDTATLLFPSFTSLDDRKLKSKWFRQSLGSNID
ncbi:MAG TPA: hypothetical protein VGB56_14235 [Flavisolibacter sp.]